MTTTVSRVVVSEGYAKVATWGSLANGEAGVALEENLWADRSVQVDGTFGVSGSVQLEGSNDGASWYVLTDGQGNPLVFAGAKIEAIAEITRYVRPRITAGDGTTSLAINLFMRRSQ